MHAYLNQESDISHFITYYIRAFDGYDSQGEQIVRSMTWKPSENLTPKQIEIEKKGPINLFAGGNPSSNVAKDPKNMSLDEQTDLYRKDPYTKDMCVKIPR